MRRTHLAILAAGAAACAAVNAAPLAPETSMVLGPPQSRALVIVRVPAPWWAPAALHERLRRLLPTVLGR